MNPLMTTEIAGLYTQERLAAARVARSRRVVRRSTRTAVADLARLWPRRRRA